MRTVALAVTEGMRSFELAVAYEVFAGAPYEVVVHGSGELRVGRFRLDPDGGLDGLARAGTVIVPALAEVDGAPPEDLVTAVRTAHEAGARVVSLCTGAFVLAAAGLLDGRRATTHWAHAVELATRYPLVEVDPDVLYVDAGTVLTSAGKAAAIDLCLHLVRADHGPAAANLVARSLVVPPHRAGGQAQFVTTPVPTRDDHPLAELLPWVASRLDQPLTVEDLARRANLSSRHLARHFQVGHRHDPAAVAAGSADPPGAGTTGNDGLPRRHDRRGSRPGHRHNTAPPLQPVGGRPAGHLPPHVPRDLIVGFRDTP